METGMGADSGDVSDGGDAGAAAGILEAVGIELGPRCFAFFFLRTVRGEGDRVHFSGAGAVSSKCSALIVACAMRSSSCLRYVEYQDG